MRKYVSIYYFCKFQMTIGYGVRFPNEECPEAIIVMVLEVLTIKFLIYIKNV